jgi:glucokinase
MLLGIEIGGTKLQLGVSPAGGSEFVDFRRLEVRPRHGAVGICEQIAETAPELIQRHSVRRLGVGFGGPVDAARGVTIRSHQIEGWDSFPLVRWCRQTLGVDAALGNDCDLATVAESRYGAGQGRRSVFYVTVGTGVGGGCVVDGRLLGDGRPAIAEIGHLRPGLDAEDPHCTVESVASGLGIARAVQAEIARPSESNVRPGIEDLLVRCQFDPSRLTAELVAAAARDENLLARRVIDAACRTLGWAVAQTVTLLAPEAVIIGGGVSRMDESLFLTPLRAYVERYVFPPLRGSYQVLPAALGERVVVYGAIALAESPT